MSEETRAAEYRRSLRARAAFDAGAIRALHGDRGQRKALQDGWTPLLLAADDARAHEPILSDEIPTVRGNGPFY